MRRSSLFLLAGALGVACRPPQLGMEAAMQPLGGYARVIAPDGATLARGELVAVTDSGVLVDDGRRLVHVARTELLDVHIRHVGWIKGRPASRWPSAAERLRVLSRFPQGLTPELARRLADANAMEPR